MSLGKTSISGLILTLLGILFIPQTALAVLTPPGLVDPSACRVGAVLSTEQFISTGFSEVRTAGPNDEVVAGSWVVANNFVFDTSIVVPPNCPLAIGSANDGAGLNLMAAKITGTTESAQHADIESIKLVWDVNVNGMWEPLLDLVLQERPATGLTNGEGILFYNGPQEPLAVLSNSNGNCIFTGQFDAAPAIGVGPLNGTNSRPGNTDGCYISLLAIAKIGDAPQTGTTFGLSMEAAAGDIPGTTGVSSHTISSGFSSSRNPQAANVRVRMFGGLPSSQTPVMHISNAAATAESTVSNITFIGGNDGLGLQTRFLGTAGLGSREVVALAVGLCDGGVLANNIAAILPSIAGANITIAGGLASLPCVASANTDGAATGISGGKIVFRGTAAHLLGTVRVYADTDCDGILFEAGELIQSTNPDLNAPTDEAIAEFGEVNGPFLVTNNGAALVGGCDATAPGAGFFDGGAAVTPAPMIVIVTVDVNRPVSSAQFGPGFIIQTLRTFLGFFFTNLRSSGFLSPYSGVMDLNPSSSDMVLGPGGGSFNAAAAREDIIDCFEKLKETIDDLLYADELKDSLLERVNEIQQQFASGDHAGALREIRNMAVGFAFTGGFVDPSASEFAFVLLSIRAKLERLEKGITLEEDIAQCLNKLRDALSDEVAGTDVANQVIELVASGDLDGAILLLDRLVAALDDEGRKDDADIALDVIFKLDELARRGSGSGSPGTSPNSLQEMFNAIENVISNLDINPFTRTGLIRDVQDAAQAARDGNTQKAVESTVSIRQAIPDLERSGILTPQEADALENRIDEILDALVPNPVDMLLPNRAPFDAAAARDEIIQCIEQLIDAINGLEQADEEVKEFVIDGLNSILEQFTSGDRTGAARTTELLISTSGFLSVGPVLDFDVIFPLQDILAKMERLERGITLEEEVVNCFNLLRNALLEEENENIGVLNEIIQLVNDGQFIDARRLTESFFVVDVERDLNPDQVRGPSAIIADDLLFKLELLSAHTPANTTPNTLEEMFNAIENAISGLDINPFTRTGLIRDVQDAAQAARDGDTQNAVEITEALRIDIQNLAANGILSPGEADELQNGINGIINQLGGDVLDPSVNPIVDTLFPNRTPFNNQAARDEILNCFEKLQDLLEDLEFDEENIEFINNVEQQFASGDHAGALKEIRSIIVVFGSILDGGLSPSDTELELVLLSIEAKLERLNQGITLEEDIADDLNKLRDALSNDAAGDDFVDEVTEDLASGDIDAAILLIERLRAALEEEEGQTDKTDIAFDLIVNLKELNVRESGGSPDTSPNTLNINNVSLKRSATGIQFRLMAQSLTDAQIQIFSTSGQLIFTSNQHRGNTLFWNLRNSAGQRVANGVYLYVITAVGADGKPITSDVKKLVVIR